MKDMPVAEKVTKEEATSKSTPFGGRMHVWEDHTRERRTTKPLSPVTWSKQPLERPSRIGGTADPSTSNGTVQALAPEPLLLGSPAPGPSTEQCRRKWGRGRRGSVAAGGGPRRSRTPHPGLLAPVTHSLGPLWWESFPAGPAGHAPGIERAVSAAGMPRRCLWVRRAATRPLLPAPGSANFSKIGRALTP
ncbi:hypothetical protein NDU88_002154 [Pleurodeles waltl]|uniref:Uncharacterized protein n=1 Tax=Pleurodeles waltl TaxID=8319 RepID=A0AAV7SA32_PLEWA|nr:hypothetical protein NDU88_002154 [Pleurodeles waltl]